MPNIISSKGEVTCQIFQTKSQPFNLDRKAIPWKGEPSPLVSLLDMLKIFAKEFWAFINELDTLSREGIFERPSGLTSAERHRIEAVVKRVSDWCKLMELDAAPQLIKDIKDLIRDSWVWGIEELDPSEKLGSDIWTLRRLIENELDDRFFMYIPRNEAAWYEKKDGFGVEVSIAFPSAVEDINEAGNCYATGRYTACVFHLMRVLEYGLGALAKDVGLAFDIEQWYDIINKIEKEIKKAQNLPRSVKKSERLKFLSEAAKEFFYFKDGWRNYVVHRRSNYDGPMALSVLNHVSFFMAHLAIELKE